MKTSIKLLVCSLLISFLFSSCYETKEYQFDVTNFTDIEDIIIKFNIKSGRDSEKKEINLKNKNRIKIKKEDFIIGYTSWRAYEIFFYPSFLGLNNGGTIEAFIYYKPMVEKEGNLYRITPCENVNKYFLFIIIEDEIIRIESENPVINMEEINNSNYEVIYIKDPPKNFMNEIIEKEFIGGYIVESNIDGSLLLLN